MEKVKFQYEWYEADREKILEEVFRIMHSKYKSWSIPLLAEWCGVSATTLRKYLKGESRYPRMDTIWKLARGVGLKFDLTPRGGRVSKRRALSSKRRALLTRRRASPSQKRALVEGALS